MAQQTSELWKRLVRDPNTRREYRVKINGVEYGEDALIAHSVSGGLFETVGIGHAAAAVLNLTLVAPEIPRGAWVARDVRLVLGDGIRLIGDLRWMAFGRSRHLTPCAAPACPTCRRVSRRSGPCRPTYW